MAGESKIQFAVDLNLPFDLARKEDFALEFLETLQAKGCTFVLPPTAIIEMELIAENRHHSCRNIAIAAAEGLYGWGISPANLVGVGHGITEQFARLLIKRGLLPEEEFDDGVILAEASLLGTAALISSDKHLCEINRVDLELAFVERDLRPIPVFSPRVLYGGMMRRKNPRF